MFNFFKRDRNVKNLLNNPDYIKVYNEFFKLKEFYKYTVLGEDLPWNMIEADDLQHYYSLINSTFSSREICNFIPIMYCRPRDEIVCFYKNNIKLIEYDIFSTEKIDFLPKENFSVQQIWESWILGDIITWHNQCQIDNPANQNIYGFEVCQLKDFEIIPSKAEVTSFFRKKLDKQLLASTNSHFAIPDMFKNKIELLYTSPKIVLGYLDNLIVIFQVSGKYFFYTSPQQVWDRIIKPDIGSQSSIESQD